MSASRNKHTSDDICVDCGAAVDQGKVGCLKLFEEILAKEFSDYRSQINCRWNLCQVKLSTGCAKQIGRPYRYNRAPSV